MIIEIGHLMVDPGEVVMAQRHDCAKGYGMIIYACGVAEETHFSTVTERDEAWQTLKLARQAAQREADRGY